MGDVLRKLASQAEIPATLPIPESELDERTDAELHALLLRPPPVGRIIAKNIWAFYDRGLEAMQPWYRRNVYSWIRRTSRQGWTVRLLNLVPGSPAHIQNFLQPDDIPLALKNGTMTGPYKGQHAADLVRLPLLAKYGGAWMDVGTLLFRDLDDLWSMLGEGSGKDGYEMAAFHMPATVLPNDTVLNSFIVALPGCGFIVRWAKICKALWATRTSTDGMHKDKLLAHLPLIGRREQAGQELMVSPEDMTDYFAHFQGFERLCRLRDPADGFDGARFFQEKMLLLDARVETFLYAQLTNWDGGKQFRLLKLKKDAPEEERTEEWKEARRMVMEVHEGSYTMKLSHAPNLPIAEEMLAAMWDQPGNRDADCEPGSWGEYLRWGADHLIQTRRLVPVKSREGRDEKIWEVGVTEPVKDA